MFDAVRRPQQYLASRYPMLRLALFYHRVPDTDGPAGHGGPISFRHFPFMTEPWSQLHHLDDLVAQKCTQVGWTEMVMAFLVMTAGILGRRTAYCLPHDGLVREFVQDKFQPMLDLSPHYRRIGKTDWRAKKADNVRLVQFGGGTIRFVGVRTPARLRAWTADSYIIDEYDDCDQRHLGRLKDRVRNSASPQVFRLGNPTLPGRGISDLYGASDGRQWHHRCDRCGERQPIRWEVNVVHRHDDGSWWPRDTERGRGLMGSQITRPTPLQDIRPVCRRCEQPFPRSTRGEWVPERPDAVRRGYHVCQMDVPSRTLWGAFCEFIEAVGDPDKLRAFYAGVLGLAYELSGARVTEGDLRDACRPYLQDPIGGDHYDDEVITCGVDVGRLLDVTITMRDEGANEALGESPQPEGYPERTHRRAIWVGALTSFDALKDLLKRYNVTVCVIDHAPERLKTEEFREEVQNDPDLVCDVWLCDFYLPSGTTARRWGIRQDYTGGGVRVARTALLDSAFGDIQSGVRTFPEDVFDTIGFSDQMGAPVRMLNERGERYVWWSGSGKPAPGKAKKPDHYRFADAYDLLAFELYEGGGGYYEFGEDED